MRFPIYESLYVLNRSVEDLLVILEKIGEAPGMPKRAFNAYKVDLDYLRSHATQDVLEVMNNKEIDEMARLGKQKKAYEDTIRDLDDVYFEVQEREEQRRKQGLPSLIGVLRGYRSTGSADESETPLSAAPPTSVRSQLKKKSTRRARRHSEAARPKSRAGGHHERQEEISRVPAGALWRLRSSFIRVPWARLPVRIRRRKG